MSYGERRQVREDYGVRSDTTPCTTAFHSAREPGWACPRTGCAFVMSKSLPELALGAFGFRGQLIALAEEAGELAAACCRLANDKADQAGVIEEAIGVESVLESIRDLLGPPSLWDAIRKEQADKLRGKLERMRARQASGIKGGSP